MRARTSGIVGAVLMLALGATGCAAQGQTTTGSPPPPATAAPASGTPTTSAGSGTPLVYKCDELLDSVTLTTLDPGLTADPVVTPAPGSSAEKALALGGTACSWSDASSQTTLVAAVAKPDAATLATLKAAAAAGTPDTEFGYATAFMSASGSELQIFNTNGDWATADSALFADPAKVTQIGQILLEELPAG